jgi:hypothetical protein
LTDSTKAWELDQLAGRTVSVAGQTRNIINNMATSLTLDSPLSPLPAAGTGYSMSNCVVGSIWHDDTHYGAVKMTVTATQLKAEYFDIKGNLMHALSLYKNTPTGVLSGTVVNRNNKQGDTYTDAAGKYSFSQIPAGPINLTASAPSYQPSSQSLTINSGANAVLNFSLNSSGASGPSSFSSGLEPGNTSEWSFASPGVSVCSSGPSCPTNSGNYAVEAVANISSAYLQKTY